MKKDKLARKVTVYPPLMGDLNTFGLYNADPMGSYTGVPKEPMEKPVQDADDL